MKIFWWQGGLHIEPETKEERSALALLLESTNIISISGNKESTVASGVFAEQPPEGIIVDSQSSPSAGRYVVK